MRTTLTASLASIVLAPLASAQGAYAQGVETPLAQPSPTIAPGLPSPVVNTPSGTEFGVGGTQSYQQLSGPGGVGIMTLNGNGTSTIISLSGVTQTVPTPR